MILHATSIDQTWHGVHTHSFHEHQSGQQKPGRSCIYQNNINHQRRHHVCPVLASHPGRLDDDINNNWRETWSEGTCDHQSIIEHEPPVKTGPGLLYPGRIRCSSGDWGIMMERPSVSHTADQRSTGTSVKSDKTHRQISNLWQTFKWSRENLYWTLKKNISGSLTKFEDIMKMTISGNKRKSYQV